MPNANANAGILQKFRMMASTAPMAYSAQGAPEPLINGSITAAIALLAERRVAACETVCLIQDQDYTAYSCCRYQGSEEFPTFLLGWCAADPISDLQSVINAGHGKRRAYHTSYNQCRYHAGCPFQPTATRIIDAKIKGHQCHA